MGRGGSEATAMWTLQALQREGRFELTFATMHTPDFNVLNSVYGTNVDPTSITLKLIPTVPFVKSLSRLTHLQLALFQRACRKVASLYELCISTYNFVDFARPGIQIIGDLSFDDRLERQLEPHSLSAARHRDTIIRRAYLRFGDLVRGDKQRPLAKRTDVVLANSRWTADIIYRSLHVKSTAVIYPPVCIPAENPDDQHSMAERDALSFVCLGRVSSEKNIDGMIHILQRVRAAGYPVTLTIIGKLGEDGYGKKISALIQDNQDWIRAPGFLDAQHRDRELRTHAFGIHGRTAEPFGIAVAEMSGSGCVTFVPANGGALEIISDQRLQYSDPDEAVTKIIAMLNDHESVSVLRDSLVKTASRFSPENFMSDLLLQIQQFAVDHRPQVENVENPS